MCIRDRSKVRHRDFPVLDENGKYVGMFSRRNLLNLQKKQVILVDHNEKSQAVDAVSYTHLDVYKRQVRKWYASDKEGCICFRRGYP